MQRLSGCAFGAGLADCALVGESRARAEAFLWHPSEMARLLFAAAPGPPAVSLGLLDVGVFGKAGFG